LTVNGNGNTIICIITVVIVDTVIAKTTVSKPAAKGGGVLPPDP
jgi:hypothetical protein